MVNSDAVDRFIAFIWRLATPVASAAIAHPRDFVVLLVRGGSLPLWRQGDTYVFRRLSRHLSERGGHVTHNWLCVATLCRCVIQIGSLNESHVLPAPSYQTSAFDGRSIPAVCDPCIDGVPPRALLQVTQSQGPDRAGTMEWLFLFDGDFCCLDYRKHRVAFFQIHSLHLTGCNNRRHDSGRGSDDNF